MISFGLLSFALSLILVPMMKQHINKFLLPSGRTEQINQGLQQEESASYSIIIVNSPFINFHLLRNLWKHCRYKICADGGANRLFEGLLVDERSNYIPDFIVGDLDSLEPPIAKFYEDLGSKVIKVSDQETNDLDKALTLLQQNIDEVHASTNHTVIVFGPFGGRFDQEMASIHALYRWQGVFNRLLLLDIASSTLLLEPGLKHLIYPINVSPQSREGEICGLLPIGMPVREITTSGLHWNLNRESLSFGHRISSSNTIGKDSEEIVIETSDPVLWTCSFPSF